MNELSVPDYDMLTVPGQIVLGYRGSIAHGMYVPNSNPDSIDDKDVMGVFIGEPEHYLGVQRRKETVEHWHKEWDCVHYEFLKFIGLLIKGNPNVLSLLWLDKKNIISQKPEWDAVLAIKESFVSKQAYYSFNGYAYSQLKKMTAFSFDGYMGAKRKQLVVKNGYDTKNAANLIRILRMGIEFLLTGNLRVDRTGMDSEELLDIKLGRWTLEKVKDEADSLFEESKLARALSCLPEHPDKDRINKMCVDVLGKNIMKNMSTG